MHIKRFHVLSMLGLFALWSSLAEPVSMAAEKGEIFLSPIFGQIGVRPDSVPAVITGTVADPRKLSDLGLKDTVAGDGIELTDEGNGRLKVRHIPTDNAVELHLK